MRIAFLGLGLIGGSIARTLHEEAAGGWSTVAWSPRGSGPNLAREAGVIDHAAGSIEEAIDGADLIVLAAPPTECLALLDELGGASRRFLTPDTVITDVASTKGEIVGLAVALGLRFVGGHPMAGRETAGFEASDAHLFVDRPWILVPREDDEPAMDRVMAMIGPTRARTIRLDAQTHDAVVAGISHLPLVLSAALVEAVAGSGPVPRADWAGAQALAATGWTGMTRLARGDVAMSSGIAATNARAIADRLRDVRTTIDEWLALLEADGGPDEVALHARFAEARARLESGDAQRG